MPTSVIFSKQGSFYSAQNKWLVAVVIDMEPYDTTLATLNQKFKTTYSATKRFIQTHVNSTSSEYDPKLVKFYQTLIDSQKFNLQGLREMVLKSRKFLREIRTMYNGKRNKRSWIPVLGDLIHTITGVATDKQVSQLRKQILTLKESNLDLAHIVEDSISVINISKIDISLNRRSINSLIDSTNILAARFDNMTYQLMHIQEFQRTILHYLQIQNVVLNLEEVLIDLLDELTKLDGALSDMFSQKITPRVISPSELANLLSVIQHNLPNTMSLPFEIRSSLLNYYQVLSCNLFRDTNGFIFTISVPLLDITSRFNLYHITTIPVFLKNQNFTSKFIVDTKALALSDDETKMVEMNDHDFVLCAIQKTHFCRLTSPIKYVNKLNNNCVLALFRKEPKAIDICKTIVTPVMDKSTTGVYLSNGNWIIVLSEQMQMTFVCPDQPSYKKLLFPPIAHVNLSLGCYASGSDIMLPPYFHSESRYELQAPEIMVPDNFHIWAPVLEVINSTKHQNLSFLSMLVGDGTQINRLKQDIKRHIQKVQSVHVDTTDKPNIPLISGLSVTSIFVIALAIWFYCRCCKLNMITEVGRYIDDNDIPMNELQMTSETHETTQTETVPSPLLLGGDA
jgi:hypothetical protein